jgi:hypothetical protein
VHTKSVLIHFTIFQCNQPSANPTKPLGGENLFARHTTPAAKKIECLNAKKRIAGCQDILAPKAALELLTLWRRFQLDERSDGTLNRAMTTVLGDVMSNPSG